jgi:hypothetical protein
MAYYLDKNYNRVKTVSCSRSVLKGDLLRSTGMDDSEAERISCFVYDELSKLNLKYISPGLLREFVSSHLLSIEKYNYYVNWRRYFIKPRFGKKRPQFQLGRVKCPACKLLSDYGAELCEHCGKPLSEP